MLPPRLDLDAPVDVPAARLAFPDLPPDGTLRRLAHTGHLTRRGRDHRGRTLYRLGDLLDLRETRATGSPLTRPR